MNKAERQSAFAIALIVEEGLHKPASNTARHRNSLLPIVPLQSPGCTDRGTRVEIEKVVTG